MSTEEYMQPHQAVRTQGGTPTTALISPNSGNIKTSKIGHSGSGVNLPNITSRIPGLLATTLLMNQQMMSTFDFQSGTIKCTMLFALMISTISSSGTATLSHKTSLTLGIIGSVGRTHRTRFMTTLRMVSRLVRRVMFPRRSRGRSSRMYSMAR